MRLIMTIILGGLISFSIEAQDVYKITFTAGVTQYRAALIIFEDGSGKMRVRFYSDGTKMVEQTMKVENTEYGLRLTGYNPVYPGTTTSHPTYNADNFYISIDENGNYSITNIDDAGVSAKTYIEQIEGTYSIKNFLEDFDWSLNSNPDRKIYFKNQCNDNLTLAIRYRSNDNDWTTKSWYTFDADKGAYLNSNGNRLKTNNSTIYIYAEIPNTNYTWSGNKSRSIDGTYYDMREYEMTIDSDGDYYISLNCTNRD